MLFSGSCDDLCTIGCGGSNHCSKECTGGGNACYLGCGSDCSSVCVERCIDTCDVNCGNQCQVPSCKSICYNGISSCYNYCIGGCSGKIGKKKEDPKGPLSIIILND